MAQQVAGARTLGVVGGVRQGLLPATQGKALHLHTQPDTIRQVTLVAGTARGEALLRACDGAAV